LDNNKFKLKQSNINVPNHYHNHEDNSWVGIIVLFAVILIIIVLAIIAKIFVIVGIIGIVSGLIMIIAGANDEKDYLVVRGIIILVLAVLLIFLGNWLSNFLVDIGAIDLANNTIRSVTPNTK
jgi:hypothetical protein